MIMRIPLKKIIIFVLLLLILTLLLISCSKQVNSDAKAAKSVSTKPINDSIIKIGICEWEPYTGTTLENMGLLTALAVSAFEEMNYEVEVSVLPWSRCLAMTESGELDATIGASYTEERTLLYNYSDVLWPSQLAFFTTADHSLDFTTIESLSPSRIGVFNGSQVLDILQAVPGLTLEPVNTVEQNIQKLMSDRVDYIIDSKDSVLYLLAFKYPEWVDTVQMMTPTYSEDNLYIIFSKNIENSDQLTKDFNSGLEILKSNGTYDQIAKKYGL